MAYTQTATALFFTLVAVASALPRNGTIFECTSEGRFADPFDCTSFFTCVSGTDGSLVRSKGDCKGHAFHPDLRTCVNPSKVPGCTSRKPKQLMSDPTLEAVCSESAFVCGDCKTVVNCIGTEAYKDSTCGDGYSCSVSGADGLAGTAACLSNDRADAACLCTEADLNLPKPDPNTDNSFVFCPPDGSEAKVHKCPQDLVYEAETKQCSSSDGTPICTQPGTYTYDDCSGTYTCLQTTNGFVKSILICPEGEMVDPKDEICSDPCTWPTQTHVCIAEGRFKDPTDCSKFFVCVETTPGSGTFTTNVRTCPSNYLWNEAAGTGGHCVDPDSFTCEVALKHTCPFENLVCPSFRSESYVTYDDTENTIQNVIQILQEEQQQEGK